MIVNDLFVNCDFIVAIWLVIGRIDTRFLSVANCLSLGSEYPERKR